MPFWVDEENKRKANEVPFWQKAANTAVDIGKGILGTGERVAGTLAQAGVGTVGAADTLGSLIAGDTQGAQEKNKKYVNLMDAISNTKAADNGSASFISPEIMQGTANPAQFAGSFTKAGTDVAALVQPELKAATLPKAIATEAGVNAATSALGTAANQVAQGQETNPGEVVNSAIQGGLLAGALRGILGKTSPSTSVINGEKTSSNMPDLKPFEQNTPTQSNMPPTPVTAEQAAPVTAALAQSSQEAPMSINDLNASATRPIGQAPQDYLREQNQLSQSPDNKTMAAEVTKPQENVLSTELKLSPEELNTLTTNLGNVSKDRQVKYLKGLGLNDEQIGQFRTAGAQEGEVVSSNPTAKNAAEKLSSSTADELRKLTGVKTGPIDQATADFIDKYVPQVSQTNKQAVDRIVSKGVDTITRGTQLLGKFGADVTQAVVKGSKTAADLRGDISSEIQTIKEQSDKFIGKNQAERIDAGKRFNNALEDRANADKYLKTDEEKQLYSNIVSVFDKFKAKMEDQGMPVRENYTPYQMLKDYGNEEDWAAKGITQKNTNITSQYAKQRNADTRGELNNENIFDLLPKYVNGMVNHIAYSPVRDIISNPDSKVPSYIRRDSSRYNEGIDYLNKLLSDSTSSGTTSKLGSAVGKAANIYYTNALWGNVKNSALSHIQKLQALADTTHEGRTLANSLDKETKDAIGQYKWFGDATLSQDAIGMNPTKTKIGELARKFDINRWSEESAASQPFRWGFADEIAKSDAYKNAIKDGKNTTDAFKEAMKDPQVLKQAEINGNMVVNNTMFAANTAARPELLRGKGTIKKVFGMFQRFGIAETQFIKDTATPNETRALAALQSGDPRKISLGEQRAAFQAYSTRLKDLQDTVKNGKAPEGTPDTNTVEQQIKIANDAVKNIDAVLKQGSNISAAKRSAALATMWLSSAAVQVMWDGAAHYGDPNHKEPTLAESIVASDPTILSKINPMNKYSIEREGINSPLNVFSSYGGINTNSSLNLVPGAGIVNRASGNGVAAVLRDILSNK